MKLAGVVISLLLSFGVAADPQSAVQLQKLRRLCEETASNNTSCRDYSPPTEYFDYFPKGRSALYTFEILQPDSCFKSRSCWIDLGEIADTATIKLDGIEIASFKSATGYPSYIRNKRVLLPISSAFNKTGHILEIQVSDLNQNIVGLRSGNISIGPYPELSFTSSVNWALNFGYSLFSAYALLLLTLLFLGTYIIGRGAVFYILGATYCLTCAIYHLSFYEYFRETLDPLFASGPLHFSLRLLQDLTLILLIRAAIVSEVLDHRRFTTAVCLIYGIAVSYLTILWGLGFKDYSYYRTSIIVMAPLIAAPAAYAVRTIYTNVDDENRGILPLVFWSLLAMQIHDLFVFWGLYNGIFFVRIYPAFIVTALFLYYWRKDQKILNSAFNPRGNGALSTAVLIHDLRSPLASLKLLLAGKEQKNDLIIEAVSQIEFILRAADTRTAKSPNLSFDAAQCIRETIDRKKIECPNIEMNYNDTLQSMNTDCIGDSTVFSQILSNILNNAKDAYPNGAGKVDIQTDVSKSKLKIMIRDQGRGIREQNLNSIGSLNASFEKLNGRGIGLWSAKRTLSDWNGSFRITSTSRNGTAVEITLARNDRVKGKN